MWHQLDHRVGRSSQATPATVDKFLSASNTKIQTPPPATEVLPLNLQKILGMRARGPQKSPTKVSTTIRLSNDVIQAFRATGDGWQTRVDAALKDWLKTHSAV